jgi:adenylate kinase
MDKGLLVPDDLIFEIIEGTLAKPECNKVMFDGFPRNLDQAKKVLYCVFIF